MWWILLYFVIGIMLFLLFGPFSFRIDSKTNSIKIKLFLIGEGGIILQEYYPWLEIKAMGLKWRWDLIEIISKTEKNKNEVKKDSKKNSFPLNTGQIKNLIQSFKIKECVLKLDTNDPALNGILFPFFYWVEQWTGKSIQIIFTQDNQLTIDIENQGYKILWAIIKKS